jgi:hypothetical protein
MRISIQWFTIIISVFMFNIAPATIINVPADFSTIQMAIDVSSNGDTVIVQPNTYGENINFNGHNIVLGSLFLTTDDAEYISTTIIDGGSNGSVVSFISGEDGTAMLVGFTLQNGLADKGGGICCNNSSPTIDHNKILGNTSNYNGGGVCCWYSNPIISNNTIINNISDANAGGGIYCMFSGPTISSIYRRQHY